MIYRELSEKRIVVKKELCTTIEQSSLSDSQKHSLLDVNNNAACLGKIYLTAIVVKRINFTHFYLELVSEIGDKQEYVNSLIKEMLLYEKPFVNAWNVIESVLGMKRSRPSINGEKLIKSFTPSFIERYQNLHSVTDTFFI